MRLFLLLLGVDCSSSYPKGAVNGKAGVYQNVDGKVDPVKENGDSKSVSDSIGVSKVKDNGGDQINVSENVHNCREESHVEAKGKTYGEKEGDMLQKSPEKSNLEAKMQDSFPPPPQPTRNDGFRDEECDSSNYIMCSDKNKRFAACLRVPGNESPYLSLLIQNKGKGLLTLKISAPAFVQLEETEVELQEKQNKKVKVSIQKSGTENLIVLKDGRGECSLDFRALIEHNSAESNVNFLSQIPTNVIVFITSILIVASGWMCIIFRRSAEATYKEWIMNENKDQSHNLIVDLLK